MKKHLSKICLALLWIVMLFLFLFAACGKEEPAPEAASSAPAAQTGAASPSAPSGSAIHTMTPAPASNTVEYDGADFCCAFPDAGDKKTDAEAHNDKNSCVNSDACPYTDTAEDARARIVRSGYHK